MVVSLGEKILREELYREFWQLFLFNMAVTGIIISLSVFYILKTKKGYAIYVNCKTDWKSGFKSLITKTNLVLFMIVFIVYLIGIFTIIRSNFYYNDDLDRSLKGYRGWAVWGRYLADFLSTLIHMDLKLYDISPLPQIVAVIFMAAATVILIKSLAGNDSSISLVIAALPIGLSPYFMENYSYKYDSPYMALSVLFSVIPFLFYKRGGVYAITSFLCLLGMCISYQSSSGIYIVIVLLISYLMWIKKDAPVKDIGKFIGISAAAYSLALIFFKKLLFVTIKSEEVGYYRTSMFSFSNLFSGIISNSIHYAKMVISDFNFNMIALCGILSVILFIITSVIFTKRNRALSFLFSLLFIIFSFILSYGAYLALQKPLWSPRAFTGFGMFIASVLFFNVFLIRKYRISKYISTGLAVLFCYNMLLFDLGYGNALAEQKEYQNFRTTMLIEDINRFLAPDIDKPLVWMENSIGFSPIIDNISAIHPLIKRIVNVLPGGGNDWGHLPLNQYKFSHLTNYDSENHDIKSLKLLPVLVDNSYHTIYGDGEQFFITLKE
jgi:hypothetical protein